MKTKQFIIPTVAFILTLTALFYSNYSIATAFFLYLAVNLFVEVRDTILQLKSKLTDAEKKFVEIEDELHHSVSVVKNQFQEINNLKTELEKAKANSYHEVERKRCREKYNRLYKGKKKSVATEQSYQIEGKTIKQLVEENLGVIVNDAGFSELKNGEICGFSKEYAVIGINDSSGWDDNYIKYDILKKYTTYWFAQKEQLINAIKKHRNIQ